MPAGKNVSMGGGGNGTANPMFPYRVLWMGGLAFGCIVAVCTSGPFVFLGKEL